MPTSLVDEWCRCQQRVSELELEYAAAMVAYCKGGPSAPDPAMGQVLADMRAQAAELLCRALGDLDRRMGDVDRRASRDEPAPPAGHAGRRRPLP